MQGDQSSLLTATEAAGLSGREPLLLSVSEAAKSLGVSHWTVRRLLAADQLPTVRIGTRVLVRTSDLADFIKDRTEPKKFKPLPLLAQEKSPGKRIG